MLNTIAGGLLAAPLAAEAQQAGKVWKVGYLDQGAAVRSKPYGEGLEQGLLPGLAAALVRLKMDVIVISTTPGALAAKRDMATIPIVIGFTADLPVGSGIVASLAHPGRNITGWTHYGLELRAKYLDLLKEAVPNAARIGVLWDPANPVHRPSMGIIESAAQSRMD